MEYVATAARSTQPYSGSSWRETIVWKKKFAEIWILCLLFFQPTKTSDTLDHFKNNAKHPWRNMLELFLSEVKVGGG